MATKTIKLGPEFLTDDKYKMLTPEGVAKIKEIAGGAKEETIVELPKGILFVNVSEDDFNTTHVVIKFPETVIGFKGSDSMKALLPSFLKGLEEIRELWGEDDKIEKKAFINGLDLIDYYNAKLPKRKATLVGRNCTNGAYGAIMEGYKIDEETARDLASEMSDTDDGWDRNALVEEKTGGSNKSYFAFPIGNDNELYCKLAIEGLELPLYCWESGTLLTDIQGESFYVLSKRVAYESSKAGQGSMLRVMPAENTELDAEEIDCFDPCKLESLYFFAGSAYEDDAKFAVVYNGSSQSYSPETICYGLETVYYCYGPDSVNRIM